MCIGENINRPVCIFDSGIGGITLLKACAAAMPGLDFAYFADNYNMPYGCLPEERIRELVMLQFKQIAVLNPLAAVVACNTATALCISDLRAAYSFPIVGIQPAIKQAVALGGTCLVLATPATVGSPSFRALCARYGQGRVVAAACPSLAEHIEQNIFAYPSFNIAGLLPAERPRSVVLGCTHYVLAAAEIHERYSCDIFDGILGTADHLKLLLGKSAQNSHNRQKIAFINGDFDKNRRVYELISNK